MCIYSVHLAHDFGTIDADRISTAVRLKFNHILTELKIQSNCDRISIKIQLKFCHQYHGH